MNNKLLNLINQAEYVSFDIFDTLIFRNVSTPTDIFTIVKEVYEKKYTKLNFNYPITRIKAEKKARAYMLNESNHNEVRLDEIYKILVSWGVDEDTCNKLMQLEIDTELVFTKRNKYIYSFYKYCIQKNKKVIVTSDIYLSLSTIMDILKNNGYVYFYKVYLSSEIRKNKSTGSLYEYIINDLEVGPAKILHIGDNIYSDISVAKKLGIKTYHYERTNTSSLNLKLKNQFRIIKNRLGLANNVQIVESIYKSLISNKFSLNNDIQNNSSSNEFWYQFGYTYIGILYYGFTKWLIRETRNNNIDHIYFLSRDGYIIKIVYDLLTKDNKNRLPSKYVYASRRAFNIPGIEKMDRSALDFLISYCYGLNVAQILERINLKPENYIKEIRATGFTNKFNVIKSKTDEAKLEDLFMSIFSHVKNVAIKEKELIYNYFNQENLFNSSHVAVVDLGWHGTLQNSLTKLLKTFNANTQLTGYYYGTFGKAKPFIKRNQLKTNSYLFNFGLPRKFYLFAKFNINLLEFIHSAPHGSVIHFKKNGKTIIPIFDKDFSKSRRVKVKQLQDGAIDFIKDIAILNKFNDFEIPIETAIKPLQHVLENPTYIEATKLGDIEYTEGFGDKYIKKYLAKPSHSTNFFAGQIANLNSFKASPWKTGYLRRASKHINLHSSYMTILKLACALHIV
jgi:HAD superfamily hydrolase (TIGR01549 family)